MKFLNVTLSIIITSVLLMSCVHQRATTQRYQLESISSSSEELSKRDIGAFVLLSNDKPNLITIGQPNKKHRLFNIYRKNGGNGDFVYQGTFKPKIDAVNNLMLNGIPASFPSFYDVHKSSIEDRYKIVPVEDGNEIDPLPISYSTEDVAYYQKIEPQLENKK